MSYTYAKRKLEDNAAHEKETPGQQGPSLAALRSGAAQPTAEQLGNRVDLPDAMRSKMENAFGADLSAVKLYESQAVADVGSKAITQGADIAFAPGLVDFSSYGGQALLGHEISHVVSQARGEVTGSGFLNDASLEARADREGAMAAAGETVAMPSASLSPVTAADAAGPMQAKDKPKDAAPPAAAPAPQAPAPQAPVPVPPASKPKQDYSRPAGEFASLTDGATHLKERYGGTSVLGVNTVDGGRAVVKMGTNPEVEEAMSDLINTSGRSLNELYGGTWNLDAPSARAPLPLESVLISDAIHEGMLRGIKDEHYIPGSNQEQKETQELQQATVFSMVGGYQRYDPDFDENKIDALKAAGVNIDPNTKLPDNPTESSDFQRTLGQAAAMDLVIGNFDRILGAENFENWLEDHDSRQIHLIDNDSPNSQGVKYFNEPQSERVWLNWLMSYAGNSGKLGKSTQHAFGLMRRNNGEMGKYMKEDSEVGFAQAVKALPKIQEKLQAEYTRKNAGGGINPYQQELLKRMQITSDVMTDPEYNYLYRELGKVGPDPLPNEPAENAEKRQKIMEALNSVRARKQREKAQKQRQRNPDLSLD